MSQHLTRRIFSPAFRAHFQHRVSHLQFRAPASSSTTPSAASKDKSRILEKPDKFRPPSHPQRLRKTSTIRQYGPELTVEERAQQRKKKYPNMMPPEGSFMFWFLTNRMIHFWIAMSVLGFCGFWSIGLNFKQNSPYYDLLPAMGDYAFHPFASIRQFLHVYKLHVEYTTAITAEKRKKEMEEVQKRRAYRVAHGLETADGPGMFPTTLHEPNQEGEAVGVAAGAAVGADGQAMPAGPVQQPEVRGPQRYKKWFGIW